MIRLEIYRGYIYTIEWWGSFDYTSYVFNQYDMLTLTYLDNSLESAVRRVQYALDKWLVHVPLPPLEIPDDQS